MPLSSETQPLAHPRSRRTSRTKSICWILGITLLSFVVLVVSPLRYFSPNDPSTGIDPTYSQYSLNTTWSVGTTTERVKEGRVDKSGDSINALPLYRPTVSFSDELERVVGNFVDKVGDLVLALFGFDEQDWFDFTNEGLTRDEEDQFRELGIEGIGNGGAGAGGGGGLNSGSGLSSWSESSLYVERTQSLHPSRPSAFGPHLLEKPLRGFLYPISIDTSSPYGCTSPRVALTRSIETLQGQEGGGGERKDWIALVQRGECPFSNKVRVAQELGAKAVVFGDEDEEKGGIRGGKGLLTPWSPDDTKDIKIPSIFVSRASYLSLIKTWQDEQRIVLGGTTSEGTQTDLERVSREDYVGLEIVLSKDEMFAWPLLDLLFLLLFLPSLLTLLTVFTQRVRMARAQKAERAPKSAVAKLVVFKWGEPSPEKGTTPGVAPSTGTGTVSDEEREIGLRQEETNEEDENATESTHLLRPTSSPSSAAPPLSASTIASPSLLNRLRSFLPSRLVRRRSSSHSLTTSSSSLPLRGANPRYPSLTDCSICLDAFVVNESIVIELPCSHIYHRDCALSWLLQKKGVCPICRKSVMDDDDDDDDEVENVGSNGGTAAGPSNVN